jgi:hypothetical protein
MLQFVESHWVEVEIYRTKVRLQCREPNALEGARYFQAVSRSMDRKDEVDGLAQIIQIHLDLLVACLKGSEGVEPAFPADGTESERRAWVTRIPWNDVSSIASEVATVGYPKTGAGSSGETTPG